MRITDRACIAPSGTPAPRTAAVAVAALALASLARADVRLPSILSDHMVLQANAEVTLWGWAEAGERVAVAPSWEQRGEARSTRADGDGRWRLSLRTPGLGGPHSLRVSGDNSQITITDILLGEVWLCGGQSNMEWSVNAIGPGGEGWEGTESIKAAADHPTIRFFDVPNVLAASPMEECGGRWIVCAPQSVGEFTAVGYFFARALQARLNTPVGLIGSNWGGTRIEAWMSEGALRALNVCGQELDFLARVQAQPELPERMLDERRLLWWSRLGAIDAGSGDAAWHADAFDDSDWALAPLPGAWDAQPAGAFDGVVWYRRSFDVPSDAAARPGTLHLGPIDDMDTVWINGRRLAGTETVGQWFAPREYALPQGALRAGANTIAIRVVDTGGTGGLTGSAENLRLAIQAPAGQEAGQKSIALAGQWAMRRGAAMSQLSAFPSDAGLNANSPSVLYNGMIEPIRRFAVQGAIWYQGESNRSNAYDYRRLFPAMIADWRASWDVDAAHFPFYFVQIAPFAYWGEQGETPVVRESQHLAMQLARNSGMVVTMDIGDVGDIHPRNKRAVGERLALWALSQTYGHDVGPVNGPAYQSMRLDGHRVEITFAAPDELQWRGGKAIGFEVAGADQRFVVAEARIEGHRVIVWSEAEPEPVAVRYGWDDDVEPTLMNAAGLPAAPFRTDDWRVVTQP